MISPDSKYMAQSSLLIHDLARYMAYRYILFEAREERLLGSLRRQRIILRLVDALIVMDSRLVIRVENMVTTSSLEVFGVDLNGAMSNPLWLALLILVSLLPVA